MVAEDQGDESVGRRRTGLFVGVVVLSLLPGLLQWAGLGIETGVGEYRQQLSEAITGDGVEHFGYGLVQGTTVYTLLEWTVVLLAMATAVLAYAHFHVKRESISLIIGVAAFWSGAVTAFHLLAFHGLSLQVANFGDFVQFNWTLSQGFTALLLVGAAGLVLWRGNRREEVATAPVMGGVVACSVAAYLIIFVTARAPSLPTMTLPEHIVSRPFDLVPLVLFGVAAGVVFPRLHRLCQSSFSLALWISTIPLMASQAYMAVVSTALFDVGFTAAQLMKVSAFAIIFAGLVWNYARLCWTERRLRERLAVSDRRIRMLFDNAEEAIVIFDTDEEIRAWNRCAGEIFGETSGAVRGRLLVETLFGELEGDVEQQRREFRRALRRFRRRRRRDDSSAPREMVIPGPNGEELTVEYTLVASDEDDETIFAMLARDVTERKHLELKMFQMDRLVAAGTLAAGVVHEIKNPLTYVSTNIDLAREGVDELRARSGRGPNGRDEAGYSADGRRPDGEIDDVLEELDEALEAAGDGSRRVRRIVDDMRVFSRTGNGETEPVSVREVLELALRMTRGEIGEQACIETDFEEVPPVDADETRLSQVFVNLMVNAAQAMNDDPADDHRLTIELSAVGDDVVARIRDTGPGISESLQAKIFRPFYTTKDDGEGTGLGLPLSKSIVECFGGELDVESTPGEGTTFEVRLPRSRVADGPDTTKSRLDPPASSQP